MTTQPIKKPSILACGAVNIDATYLVGGLLNLDGKQNEVLNYRAVGGGGANSALAIKAQHGESIDVCLVTEIGTAGIADQDKVSFILDTFAQYGITVIDHKIGQPFSVPASTVVAHSEGRAVIRNGSARNNYDLAETEPPVIAELNLRHDFKTSQKPENPDRERITAWIDRVIEKSVLQADHIIIQPKNVALALKISKLARQYGKPITIDYSADTPETVQQQAPLLSYATYVLMASEAQLPGEKTFSNQTARNIMGQFPNVQFVSVSSIESRNIYNIERIDQNSVRIFSMDLPSIQSSVVDPLGAGDNRTGQFAALMAQGASTEEAIIYANQHATFSVQHPGRSWRTERFSPEPVPDIYTQNLSL